MRSLLWGEIMYLHVGAEKAALSKYNIWRGFFPLHIIKKEQQPQWLRQYKTLTNSALNHSEVKEPGSLWFRKFPATLCLVYYCQPKAGSVFPRHLPTAANSSMTPERVTGLSGGLERAVWTGKRQGLVGWGLSFWARICRRWRDCSVDLGTVSVPGEGTANRRWGDSWRVITASSNRSIPPPELKTDPVSGRT